MEEKVSMGDAEKRKYMSVEEMGKLLGLKKTGRYWLLKKNYFRVVKMAGKMWIDIESFEKWYASQIHYHKISGEEPGTEIRREIYTLHEIMEILGISQWTVYEILAKNDLDIITVNQKQCVRKESFWNWYNNQSHYRTTAERKQEEREIGKTLAIPEAAALLGLERKEFEKVMRHWHFGSFLKYVYISGRKRITKESFLLFLQKQDKYRYDPLHDNTVVTSRGTVYLTIEQASWYARVKKSRIISWYNSGKIGAVRAGRLVRIPLSELKEITD